MNTTYSIAQTRKAIVAWTGVAVMLANSGLAEFASYLPEGTSKWVNVGIGAVTAVSVFLVKNGEVIDDISDGRIDGVAGR